MKKNLINSVSLKLPVEKAIGLMKTRFQCINKDNMMRYDPSFVGQIITVIASLHNMMIHERINFDVLRLEYNDDDNDNDYDRDDNIFIEDEQMIINNEREDGNRRRKMIVIRFFGEVADEDEE